MTAVHISGARRALLGNQVARTVLSAWAWLIMGVLLVVWVPLTAIVRVVTAPFDRGRYWTGFVFRRICVVHQWFNPLWRFEVTGERITDPRRPYVVVANHESFVDMILISHLPWEMKWMSKRSLFRIPFLGWLMRMSNDIELLRGSRDSILSAVAEAHERLRSNVSVMMFPEGTRSRSGELGEFKDGAFRIAVDAGVPILPLAVAGTREALKSHDWRMNVTNAEVRVLPAIDTTGCTLDDVPALRDRTRAAIAAALVEMRH